LITDTAGNLFGTTLNGGGVGGLGTVFELAKSGTLTTLYSFCALGGGSCPDGAGPQAGLLADASGNLFGTTVNGGSGVNAGPYRGGTVFELPKTASGFASTLTTLYSFCAQGGASCTDGQAPAGGLVADAAGNLFGTTSLGGVHGAPPNLAGTVFELSSPFAGTPGKANCHGSSVSALAKQYGGLNNAAAALGFASVQALQDAITAFCAG
jgi:uncharacterized repeat protein (TIGR03803 family)